MKNKGILIGFAFCMLLGLIITVGMPKVSAEGTETYVIEAESGTIAGEWQVKEDAACSGGKFIVTSADKASTPNPAQSVKYVFNIKAAGKYKVFLRLLTLTDGESSVHLQMNSDPKFRTEFGNQGEWYWNFLNNDNVDVPVTFNLVAGENTLIIYHREPDVRIDKFLITSDTSLKVDAIDALK